MAFKFYTTLFMVILTNCAPQLSGGKTAKEKANGGKVETIGTDQVDIITRDGTAVTIPPGALAVGSQVTVQPTSQPTEFAATAASGVVAASSPLEFTATGPDGLPVNSVATPMTINIPLANVGSGLTLQNSNDELCTLLKSTSGDLYVWRRNSLTVDEAAAAVIVETLYFGVFQLVYCGNTVLPDFKDAADQGITGEAKYNLSMIVPADYTVYAATRHCLLLVEEADNDTHAVVATTSGDPVAASDTVMTLSIAETKLNSSRSYFLALTFQPVDVECPFTAGSAIPDQDLGVSGLVAFKLAPEAISAGLEATLGTGDFALDTVEVIVGAPDGVEQNETSLVDNACIFIENTEGSGLTEVNGAINSDGSINGEGSLTAYVPAGSGTVRVNATVGTKCGSSGGDVNTDTARPFTADLSGLSIDEPIYLVPVRITLNSGFAAFGSNACITVSSSAQGTEGRKTEFLVNLSSGPNFDVLLPYSTTEGVFSYSGTDPLYDMSIAAITDNCQTKTLVNALPGFEPTNSVPAKPLNGSITLPE